MTLEDAFLEAIALAPGDPVAKLIYADWLGEQDDPLESVVRWCAEHGKWPEWDRRYNCWRWYSTSWEVATLPAFLRPVMNSFPIPPDSLRRKRYGRWCAPTIRETLALLDRVLQAYAAEPDRVWKDPGFWAEDSTNV